MQKTEQGRKVYLSLVYNGKALRLVSGSDDGLAEQREGSNRHGGREAV